MYIKIKESLAIDSFDLPRGFKKVRDNIPGKGIGNHWISVFSIDQQESVSISVFYRGKSELPHNVEQFRNLLSAGSREVYTKDNENCADEVKKILPILGNTGNNQILDEEGARMRPGFELERLSIRLLNRKAVMQVIGWFHDEKMKFTKHFNGIFIDANPDSSDLVLEEVYLQTVTESLALEYQSVWEKTLSSIIWSR